MKNSQLAPVLERIRRARNVDFREYKRATLLRRIESRTQEAKVESVRGYLTYLDGNPREMDLLLSSMLIKVTSAKQKPRRSAAKIGRKNHSKKRKPATKPKKWRK